MKKLNMVTGLEALSGMRSASIDELIGLHEDSQCYFEVRNGDDIEIIDHNHEIISFNKELLNECFVVEDNMYDEDWDTTIVSRIYHQDCLEYDVKKSQYFLSHGGNILVSRENELSFWVNPKGHYLKTASEWEVENVLTEIHIPVTWESLGLLQSINRLSAETWTLINTINTGGDDSNYKSATCNNGGDYGYSTTMFLFESSLGRKAQLELTSTTAELKYDEVNASFDQDASGVYVMDVNEDEDFIVRMRDDSYSCLLSDIAKIVEEWDVEYYYTNENGEETRHKIDIDV